MSDETPSLSTGLFKGLTPEDANGILQAGERMSFASSGVRPLNRPVPTGWGLVAHRFHRHFAGGTDQRQIPPSLSTGLFKGLTPEDANGILQAGERMSFASSGVRPLNRPVDRDGVSSLIGSSAGQSGGGSLRTWAGYPASPAQVRRLPPPYPAEEPMSDETHPCRPACSRF